MLVSREPVKHNTLKSFNSFGFDSLDFDFDGRGAIFEGKCMATVALSPVTTSPASGPASTSPAKRRSGRWSSLFSDVPAVVDAAVQAPSLASSPPNASVATWFDNHAAAISIADDDRPTPGRQPDVDSHVMEQGLVIGYGTVAAHRCIVRGTARSGQGNWDVSRCLALSFRPLLLAMFISTRGPEPNPAIRGRP